MANSKITTAMKEEIRAAYRVKTDKLTNAIEKRLKHLAKEEEMKVKSAPEYFKFKRELTDFIQWMRNTIPEKYRRNYTNIRLDNLVKALEDDTLVSAPTYISALEDMFGDDETISALEAEKKALTKECNHLIWNIEMSPKKSDEYKEAVARAERIVFGAEE